MIWGVCGTALSAKITAWLPLCTSAVLIFGSYYTVVWFLLLLSGLLVSLLYYFCCVVLHNYGSFG